MSEPTSRVLRDVRTELAATECGHEPVEGTGGAIECVCGWPTRADFDARDPGTWVPDYNIHLLDELVAAAERAERDTLPLSRTEAGWPNCSTCDGGGCPDCTDPA